MLMSNYVQIGEETIARMFDDELMHFGIKGQTWGKRRYQNEDGSLTPEGRLRYANDVDKYTRKAAKTSNVSKKAKYEQRVKDARNAIRKDNLASARKAKEEKAKFEADKKKALESGTAEEILKYKGKMTSQEMQSAIDRLQKEQTLAKLVPSEPRVEKGEHFMDKVGRYTDYAITGIKAWNTIANIYNGLNVNGVRLPKIDIENSKSNRDLVRKDLKEKRKEDAKKADEASKKAAEERAEKDIEKRIKKQEKDVKKREKKREKDAKKDAKYWEEESRRAKEEKERQAREDAANSAKNTKKHSDDYDDSIIDAEWTERTVYDTSIPAISSSKTTQRGLDYTEQLLLGYNEYPLARR